MTRRALGCADVLRRSGWVALPIVCTWLVVSLVAQQSVTSAALQGTWALRSLSYDGVPQTATGYMIFQGSHYSFLTNRTRENLTPGIGAKSLEELTEQEKQLYINAFRNMTAAAGPFTVEGDQIVYVMEVVRTPNLAGRREERKSWFENGRLVQDFMGGGRRQVYVWERVEEAPEAGSG